MVRLPVRRLACLVLLASACSEPAPVPDLVLTDGRVFTADSARPWAEAVAVAGDSILAVGPADSVSSLGGEATRTVDLEGRLVVPGLNDAHGHLTPSGDGARLETRPSAGPPDPTRRELLAALRAAVDTLPAGTWIRGGFGTSILFDETMDRGPLDRIAPDHPVLLGAWTGHGWLANGRALEALGFGRQTPDPPGGWLGRRGDGRTPDGWLWEGASIRAVRRATELQPDRTKLREIRDRAAALARWGITTFQHMSVSFSVDDLARLVSAADVPVRWTVYRWGLPRDSVADAVRDGRDGDATPTGVRLAGVKWLLDATPVERYAALRQPYADRPGWNGRLNYTPQQLRVVLAAALERGEQPAFHVSGDSTMAVLFRTMREVAPDASWRALRVRIEHGDGLAPDLVGPAVEMGVVLVQNPLHFSSEVIPARFGERTRWVQPLASARAAGVPVALGADAGGAALNPWLNVMLAVRHPNNPDEALTREQALLAYTRGAAYAERREEAKGTIAPGMLADLAVLSQDVFEVPLEALPATRSILTVIGGRVVVDEADGRTADPGRPTAPREDRVATGGPSRD